MDSVRKPGILVVDDTPRDRDLLTRILEGEGFRVIQAEDGGTSLELAAREPLDLILLDVAMPEMDGLEACRRLKADPGTRAIPVIFLTGKGSPEEILLGFQAGAVDYVPKPFHIQELLARVRVHVELRRLQGELRSLHGILPTCAGCKKIRDAQGTWHAIEAYISEHSAALFSHGLCPECLPIYFPEAAVRK